ncbi:MAG TPA: hypothetical protein VK817_15770 [Trebonia sp.]|jgi:hypothetical protein|nr:hypothetical protein [Trebonia sp.]
MERYLETLADMRRRELITGARPDLGAARAGDPLRGAPRARMMWWIAADRLRRAACGPAAAGTATIETTRGAR